MTTLLASAVSQSPTFVSLMANPDGTDKRAASLSSAQSESHDILLDGEPFEPIEESEEDRFSVSVDDFIEGLTVTATVCKAQKL